MGLFSWFTPSPEKRLARARRALEQGDWALARDEVLDLEGDEAAAIRKRARDELVRKNLDAAVSWAQAGDEERVRVHLELAAEHHDGGFEDLFREARREIRELREAERAKAEEAKRRHDARTLSVDPLHLGQAALAPPRASDDLVGPDGEELRARLALVVENYPETLRAGVPALGPEFAQAVIDLEDGRPDLALQALKLLPDDAPLVRWERARCAYGLGDPRTAAHELERFAELAHGHVAIGRTHSALMLAQVLAEGGDPDAGLRVLRDARARDRKLGGFLEAQLLATTDRLPEADAALRELVRQNPLEPAYYKLLAFVRVRGGQRVEAMRALEQGLHQNACASGQCGARPPDPEIKRLLAMLYLEDGIETKRALQLLDEAPIDGGPGWDDLYVGALAARATGRSDEMRQILGVLRANTPDDDPRAERLRRYLPAPT
jgi:tetratricopeptide (TPR) repeat protein